MNINPTKLILGVATPFVAAASAWLVAAAAKYGVHLNAQGVTDFGIAGATAGAAVMVKLIHDVERLPAVERIIHTVEGAVIPVATAVQAADPGAKASVEAAAAEVEKRLQEQFNTLVASLPQPAPVRPPASAAPTSASAAPADPGAPPAA